MKETHIEQYFLEKKDSIHSEYNYQNRFQRTIFHINLPSLFACVAVLSVSPQPSGKRDKRIGMRQKIERAKPLARKMSIYLTPLAVNEQLITAYLWCPSEHRMLI